METATTGAIAGNAGITAIAPLSALSVPAGLTSPEGVDFIKEFETFEAEVYTCPAGIPTIGYGRVVRNRADYPARITEAHALELLAADLEWAEEAVKKNIRVDLEQCEFDALVSFTFNAGSGALQSSTARRRINRGDFEGGMEALQWWHKGGRPKKSLPGLVRRRLWEAGAFLFGIYDGSASAAVIDLLELE